MLSWVHLQIDLLSATFSSMLFCRIPEPPYTIIQEPPIGHPDFLVAEIHLPKLVSIAFGFIFLFRYMVVEIC